MATPNHKAKDESTHDPKETTNGEAERRFTALEKGVFVQ